MVDLHSRLNALQLAVLEWVGAGCPDGVMQGHTYKTVAVALQNRHLVAVSKRGGTWRAEVTDMGRYYLDHGTYPAHPTPNQPPNQPLTPPRTRRQPRPATGAERATTPTRPERLPDDDPAELLVRRVLDAGGALEIDTDEDHTNYDSIIVAAKDAPSLPFGKKLRQRRKGHFLGPLSEIYFDEDFTVRVDERPVPVPARVAHYHPAIAAYRDDSDRHEVSKDSLGRASRILHALATEAERRGHTAGAVATQQPRAKLTAGQLVITIDDYHYSLRIRERSGQAGGPSPRYSASRRPMPRWELYRQSKFIPTGSLTLTVGEGYGRDGRPAEFRDTKTTPLERRLPRVLRELEIRALEDDWRRQEEERRAQARRRRWEQAMDQAKHDLRETHRADILRDQLERWHTATQLDRYLAEMRKIITTMASSEDRVDAERWLAWASEYRHTIDPLHHRLAMPPDPRPTPEALQPFLRGWSPYGPHGYP